MGTHVVLNLANWVPTRVKCEGLHYPGAEGQVSGAMCAHEFKKLDRWRDEPHMQPAANEGKMLPAE